MMGGKGISFGRMPFLHLNGGNGVVWRGWMEVSW